MTDDITPTDEPSDNQIQSLERRVAELEAMTEVDSDGDDGGLSLPDLLDLGLTRRQALMAIALVGAGWQLGPAITKSISEPAAASHGGATLGTQDDPLEAIYVEDLNQTTDNIVTDSITTDELNTTLYVDAGSNLQTALDDAESAGGGAVVVTSSVSIPNPIEQPTSVALVGGQEAGYDVANDAAYGTVLTAQNAAPMHQWRDVDGNVTPSNRSRGVYGGRIENLVFDGASTATTGADWHGIQRCRAENVGFVDTTGNGWHVRGEDYQGGGVFYCHLKTILGLRGDRGLVMENNGRRANDNLVENAYLSRCQKEGLDVSDCHGNHIDADMALNLQDGAYDPTTNGSSDDPLGRTEAVFRNGCENNTTNLWIEQGTDAGVYIGSDVSGTDVFGQSRAGGDPDWYFASDAGRGNAIWASMSMQVTQLTNTDMVFPVGVANVEPKSVAMANDGRPVQKTGNFNTTSAGNYAGIELEVLEFDGTSASSGTNGNAWVGFMT